MINRPGTYAGWRASEVQRPAAGPSRSTLARCGARSSLPARPAMAPACRDTTPMHTAIPRPPSAVSHLRVLMIALLSVRPHGGRRRAGTMHPARPFRPEATSGLPFVGDGHARDLPSVRSRHVHREDLIVRV